MAVTPSEHMDTSVMRAFLWSGVVVIVALIFAQGYLMGFIPPPAPSLSAIDLAHIFIERRTNILIGAVIQCVCWTFYSTWAVAIIMFIRKMERGMPLLTYASLVNNGGGYVFFLLIPMTWAVIAYRADVLDPSIIRVMNDWVWFDWLYTWPPFTLWMIIIGVAIFKDHNSPRIFPRWLGYYNIWSGIGIIPAGFIGFSKTGPFAYNGLISFWWDILVYFGWMVTMTVMTFRAVATQERLQQDSGLRHPSGSSVSAIAA